jgi:hypothetical protein
MLVATTSQPQAGDQRHSTSGGVAVLLGTSWTPNWPRKKAARSKQRAWVHGQRARNVIEHGRGGIRARCFNALNVGRV